MSKWILDQSDEDLDYPTLGFLAEVNDILDATAAPDGRWSLNADQGAAETVTRYIIGGDPNYEEPGDGHVLTWSDVDNAYVPTPRSEFVSIVNDESFADFIADQASAAYAALQTFTSAVVNQSRAVSAAAYGAVGDGVTDDGPALQDALDDLAQTDGTAFARTLYLEVGKCYLTNQGLTINAPVSIWGLNQMSTSIKAGPTFPDGDYLLSYIKDAFSPLTLEGRIPGVSVTGFALDGNERANQVNGLQFNLFDRATVDLRFNSLRGTAFKGVSFRESNNRLRTWLCGDPDNPTLILDQTIAETAEGANLNHFIGCVFALNMGDDMRISCEPGVVARSNFFTDCIFHSLNEWIENYADELDYFDLDQEGNVSGRIVIDNARSNFFNACRFHLNGRGQPKFWLSDHTAGTSTANSVTISNSLVSFRGGAYTARAVATVDAAADTFEYVGVTDPVSGVTGSNRNHHQAGSRVQVTVSTGGSLPTGLALATDYYTIPVSDTLFKVASSRANALAGTEINITDAGSGTIVFTQYDTSVVVTVATDKLYAPNHRITTGARYRVDGSAVPTGLATSTDYFVIRVDKDNIRLATTLANALAGTYIDITSTGTAVYITPQDFLGHVEAGTLNWAAGNTIDGPVPARGYFRVRDNGASTPYGALIGGLGQIWSAGAGALVAEYSSGAQQLYRFPGALLMQQNNHPIYMTRSDNTTVQVANYSAGNVASFGTLTGTDNARLYAGGIATVNANGGTERFRAGATGVAFNGVTTQVARRTVNAAAVDAATNLALTNQLRQLLIDLGFAI